jgi:hypothetical protein
MRLRSYTKSGQRETSSLAKEGKMYFTRFIIIFFLCMSKLQDLGELSDKDYVAGQEKFYMRWSGSLVDERYRLNQNCYCLAHLFRQEYCILDEVFIVYLKRIMLRAVATRPH